MAIKKTLLEIVQDILSDIDSEPVNSLSDSTEADQIATIVEHAFYDITALRTIPEHNELIKLVPMSDVDYPTTFILGDNVRKIDAVWYDTSADNSFEYTCIPYVEPERFLKASDSLRSNYVSVQEITSGTTLRIGNDSEPTCYTSFDDEHLVFNSFDSDLEDTLQQSKTRAMGIKIPIFERTDSYVPDIDNVMFPQLITESRARAMDFFKGGVTQKAEQAARRAKIHVQNDQYRDGRMKRRLDYGRNR